MTLSIDEARGLHISDLRRHPSEVARCQLALRMEGTDTVLGVLQTLGYCYRGTGGWWITAYADGQNRLGFVNNAKGIAVITSIVLSPAVVEALTIPNQVPGPQVSGAAAWTSPDVGEARNASAPNGWVQLLVDLRMDARGAPYTAERSVVPPAVPCTARVIRWGLATCYQGLPGEPGYTALDPAPDHPKLPLSDWPCSKEIRRRMAAVADRRLHDLAHTLGARTNHDIATLLPVAVRPPAADLCRAQAAVSVSRGYDFDYADPADVAHTAVHHEVIREILREYGVSWVAWWETSRASSSYYGLIEQLCRTVVVPRLIPIAAAIRTALEPLMPRTPEPGQQAHMPRWALHRQMEPMVAACVRPLLDPLLKHFDLDESFERPARKELLSVYYSEGPVEVSFPHPITLGGCAQVES